MPNQTVTPAKTIKVNTVQQNGTTQLDLAERADALIRRYALYATGSALIPGFGLDVAAVTAVQTKMISELGKMYGFENNDQLIRTAVTAGITALGSRVLSGALAGLAKTVTPMKGLIGGAMQAGFSGFVTAETGFYYLQRMQAGDNPGDVKVTDIVGYITDQVKAGKFNPTSMGGLKNQLSYLFPAKN